MQFIKKYFFSIVVAIGIFYLSTTTSSALSKVPKIEGLDKIVHFLMYAGFAFVLLWENWGKKAILRYIVAIAFPILYGGLMEIIQQFFPPRTTDFFDFLANTAGVLVGYFVAWWFFKRKTSEP
ncbi:MAG: VanZ family protein [Bacteroidetes bacterium]|nr:VanZ family protein [Bacteroidota bacterium]